MIINGQEQYYKNVTIIQLLNIYNLDKDVVVVEVNKKIISKDKYDSYKLNSSDKVEIVRFVGGG